MTSSQRIRNPILITILGALFFGGDCAGPKGPQSLRTSHMTLAGKDFTIEVADTDKTREVGLMRRDSMPADHGMIFVFDKEEPREFWMKNTRIDLDIAYLDASGKVVSCHTMKAYDITGVPAAGPAKYAVEVNSGVLNTIGLKSGDSVQIPADAKEPAAQ